MPATDLFHSFCSWSAQEGSRCRRRGKITHPPRGKNACLCREREYGNPSLQSLLGTKWLVMVTEKRANASVVYLGVKPAEMIRVSKVKFQRSLLLSRYLEFRALEKTQEKCKLFVSNQKRLEETFEGDLLRVDCEQTTTRMPFLPMQIRSENTSCGAENCDDAQPRVVIYRPYPVCYHSAQKAGAGLISGFGRKMSGKVHSLKPQWVG